MVITNWLAIETHSTMEDNNNDKMEAKRQFDLIIFGATGFAGHFVVRELFQTLVAYPEEYAHLTWAIAGRSEAKLVQTLQKVGKEVQTNLDEIPKFVANVDDPKSLVAMTRSCRVLLNCVGPFRDFGEPVFQACLETRTHHLDITAELDWIDKMTLKYHDLAVERNILMLFACGFGCVPFDIGLEYLKQCFDGILHSGKSLFELRYGAAGYKIHSGTMESVMYNFTLTNMFKIHRLERQVNDRIMVKKMPKSRAKSSSSLLRYRFTDPRGWAILYKVVESPIANRSQKYNYQHFAERPATMKTYYKAQSTLELIGISMALGIFGVLNLIPPCRWLIKKAPALLTCGWFSKAGPTRRQVDGASFSCTFVGRGWSRALEDDHDPCFEPRRKFDKKMVVRVDGPDPSYITTAICLVQTGLTLITERPRMPSGTITPGSAFHGTNLIHNLDRRGLRFSVVRDDNQN